eukprot:11073312-Ditylum_brightwellii.AAC.1
MSEWRDTGSGIHPCDCQQWHKASLKSNQVWMYAESLSDFLKEVPSSTRDFLFKLTFPPHNGSLFCNLLLDMCLKKMPLSEDRAFLDKEL